MSRSACCSALSVATSCCCRPMFAGSCRFSPRARTTPGGHRATRRRRDGRGSPLGALGALPPVRAAGSTRPADPRTSARQPLTRGLRRGSLDQNLNGKAGSARRRPVVRRAVRLPGDVPAARAGEAGPRAESGDAAAASPRDRQACSGSRRSARSDAAALEQVPSAAPVVSDTAERDVAVENESVRAVFTTRGGASRAGASRSTGTAPDQPLELVPQTRRRGFRSRSRSRSPTIARCRDAGAGALQAERDRASTRRAAPQTLTFEYQDASGLAATKEFSFTRTPPTSCTSPRRSRAAPTPLVPTVHWGPAIGTSLEVNTSGYNPPPQPIFYRDGTSSASPRANRRDRRSEGHVRVRRRRRSLLPERGRQPGLAAAAAVSGRADTAENPAETRRRRSSTGRATYAGSAERTPRSSSVRRTSTCSPRSIASWSARSTSACSAGWSCRCSAR